LMEDVLVYRGRKAEKPVATGHATQFVAIGRPPLKRGDEEYVGLYYGDYVRFDALTCQGADHAAKAMRALASRSKPGTWDPNCAALLTWVFAATSKQLYDYRGALIEEIKERWGIETRCNHALTKLTRCSSAPDCQERREEMLGPRTVEAPAVVS